MTGLAVQNERAAVAVRRRWDVTPHIGIILGSGLGQFAQQIDAEQQINYADVPGFPLPTAMGHAGRLVCGRLDGVPVVAFQGRFHLYEGHSAATASLPVRLLQALGGRNLIVSNAAGGLNPAYEAGEVMVIDDQINFLFRNPLIGVNDDELGPRFPDMSAPYDRRLQRTALAVARQADFVLHRGTYVAVLGPNYETRAEIRMFRRLGGDAIGMSTAPEVIAARHAGMRVLGLSTITNVCTPDARTEASGHDVLAVAATAADRLATIVCGVVASL